MIFFCQQILKYLEEPSNLININSVFERTSWHSQTSHPPESCFLFLDGVVSLYPHLSQRSSQGNWGEVSREFDTVENFQPEVISPSEKWRWGLHRALNSMRDVKLLAKEDILDPTFKFFFATSLLPLFLTPGPSLPLTITNTLKSVTDGNVIVKESPFLWDKIIQSKGSKWLWERLPSILSYDVTRRNVTP